MRKPTARMTSAMPRFETQIDMWGFDRSQRFRAFELGP
jgi:hypothetical protein